MPRSSSSVIDDNGERFPPVDEHLAPIEQPYEVWNGELVPVSPAKAPHAGPHIDVGTLLRMYVTRKYWVAADMLTRVSVDTDIAPDVSVIASAKDPETGGRQVEELAFEIVSKSSLRTTGQHAAKLVRRGVRRVFALDVKRNRVMEWSTERCAWHPLDPDGYIKDQTLVRRLPITALIEASLIDNAVMRSLMTKRNPVLQKLRARERAKGEAKGLAKGEAKGLAKGEARGLGRAIFDVLALRRVTLTRQEQDRIHGEDDPAQLRAWLQRAVTCASGRELF